MKVGKDMLYNNDNANPEGQQINVDNSIHQPKKEKTWIIVLLCIITLGLFAIYFIAKKNELNAMQIKVNECASSVDTQLAKRKDTLVKLVDATKSMCEFESSFMEKITKLRNISINENSRQTIDEETNSAFARLLAVTENYPQVKTTDAFMNLMNSAEYLEREISAARRTYNSAVAQFNVQIVTWPGSYIAAKNNMHTLKMFEASASQKEDVSLKF